MSSKKLHKTTKRGFAQSLSPVFLSACLIVKNEEQRLSQCLDSLKILADEIVVVDTGSSDRTVMIAKKYQAKVFNFAWCDDFSQARNYAIAQARGAWILVIDADEILAEGAIAIFQKVMQCDDCIAANLLRIEVGAKQTPYSLVLRLFRNHPAIAFTGIYHESIDQSVTALQAQESHWQVLNVEVPVLSHYGYTNSEIELKQKHEFAKRLMHKHLEVFPEDSYMLNKLGALYIDSDRIFGMELLQKGLSLIDVTQQQNLTHCELYFHLGLAHAKNGDLELAKSAYIQAIALEIPEFFKLSAYLNLGNIYQELNQALNPQEAIATFEIVTKIAPDFAQGYFNLGIALKISGQFIEAIAAYQKAISLDPNYAEAHQNLGVALIKIGCLKDAIVAFQVGIKLYEQQNNYQAAEILRSVLQEFGRCTYS